jgi:tRNA(fMet)-specific endonuclease VapC
MNGNFLLDTNIVIAMFADEPSFRERLKSNPTLFIPSVVLGELYYGALASIRIKENLKKVDDLARLVVVLNCDARTARRFGEVKNGLRQKGRPIPENDVWIAALCLDHNLTLVSRDFHFEAIDGLRLQSW